MYLYVLQDVLHIRKTCFLFDLLSCWPRIPTWTPSQPFEQHICLSRLSAYVAFYFPLCFSQDCSVSYCNLYKTAGNSLASEAAGVIWLLYGLWTNWINIVCKGLCSLSFFFFSHQYIHSVIVSYFIWKLQIVFRSFCSLAALNH